MKFLTSAATLAMMGVAHAQLACPIPQNTLQALHATQPQTSLHYTANGNFSGSTYLPYNLGFNLADVSSAAQVDALPFGVQGLVFIGTNNGVDTAFLAIMNPFQSGSHPHLYGFYLADEPDPNVVPAATLKAETDWIHTNLPGYPVFLALETLGTPNNPTYFPTPPAVPYNPSTTDVDLFGLDPYPIRAQFSGGQDFTVIAASVNAAIASGIPVSKMIPVYQAFGGGGFPSWTLPTAAQAQTMLTTWGSLVPKPAFDYTYSYGVQLSDTALSNAPTDLQAVFGFHNSAP